MTSVDLVTGTGAFARLEPAWRALESSPGLLGPFHGYTWQREWWLALGGGRSLRILVAREGERVTGIFPLYEELRDGARCLSFIGSPGGGSDDLDILCADDATRAALVKAACELGVDLLELEDITSTSPLIAELQTQASQAGQRAKVEPRYPCPYIPIATSWADYQRTIARQDTLKRRQKWFVAQPGFRITCETSPDEVPAYLDRYFRLHEARWGLDGGTQAFQDARLAQFHRAVTLRLAQESRARLWTMWVAKEAVAVAYSFEDRGRSLYYQAGFLPAWGGKSAGLVLFAKYVEDAFERGQKEVDLLRGAEPYKLEWTKEARATVAVRWALTARGQAALKWRQARTAAREKLRDALPANARDMLSRFIRERRLRGVRELA